MGEDEAPFPTLLDLLSNRTHHFSGDFPSMSVSEKENKKKFVSHIRSLTEIQLPVDYSENRARSTQSRLNRDQ